MKNTHALLLILALAGTVFANNNLLLNGDFSNNDCSHDSCVYNANSFISNCVDGWAPQQQFELGYGSSYCDYLTKEPVVRIAPSTDSCISQQIPNIQPGNYNLQFDWAAVKGSSFNDCQFQVWFNGQVVGHYLPVDYQVHTVNIPINVSTACDLAELKFIGIQGINLGCGSIIKGIQFYIQQQLQQIQQNLQFQPLIVKSKTLSHQAH
jgi:hypothetical protein